MAIMVIMEVPGMTLGDYEQLDDQLVRMGASRDELPEGCLAHAAGETEDGLAVVDVWESPEAFEDFVETQLVPAAQALEVDFSEFQPDVRPVHNRIHAGTGETAGVLLIMDIPGMTTDDYDQVTGSIPAHAGDGSAHPSVSHTVAATDEGILVVDVWESPEHFEQFADEHLAPAMPEGAPPIEPRVVPLHTHRSAHSPATASR